MHSDDKYVVIRTIIVGVLYMFVSTGVQYSFTRLCYRSSARASLRLILIFTSWLCVLPCIGYAVIHNFIGAMIGLQGAAVGISLANWKQKIQLSK